MGRGESSSPTRTSTSSKRRPPARSPARATRPRRRSSSTPPPATTARRPARRRSTPGRRRGSARSTWPATPGRSAPAPDIGAFEFVPAAGRGGAHLADRVTEGLPAAQGRRGGRQQAQRRKARGTTVRYALTAARQRQLHRRAGTEGPPGRRQVPQADDGQPRARRGAPATRRSRAASPSRASAGENRFRFSGRVGAKALAPGKYRLVARAGASVKRAAFTITR